MELDKHQHQSLCYELENIMTWFLKEKMEGDYEGDYQITFVIKVYPESVAHCQDINIEKIK